MSDDLEPHIAHLLGDLRAAMARRRAARVGTDEPAQAWNDIAHVLCIHVGSQGGKLFGEVIVDRLGATLKPKVRDE